VLQPVELLPAAPLPAAEPGRPPLPVRPAEEEPARPPVPPRPAAELARPPVPPRPAAELPARPPVPPRSARPASANSFTAASFRSRSPVPGRSCDFEHPTSSSALTALKARPIVRLERKPIAGAESSRGMRARCRLIVASSGREPVSAMRLVKVLVAIILGWPTLKERRVISMGAGDMKLQVDRVVVYSETNVRVAGCAGARGRRRRCVQTASKRRGWNTTG
jgi:hypothetical protein